MGKSFFNQRTSVPEHDGVHAMDVLHIVIAKRMGCSNIATDDRDFEETRSEIEPMLLD